VNLFFHPLALGYIDDGDPAPSTLQRVVLGRYALDAQTPICRSYQKMDGPWAQRTAEKAFSSGCVSPRPKTQLPPG